MHVVLPEVDGRIFAHAIAFKERGESSAGFAPTTFRPVDDRIAATVDLAWAWVRLRRTPRQQRRVAMVLANYPSRDGRLANGVGLDTPQSLIDVLGAMRGEGYAIEDAPDDAASMMQFLQAGPTNALRARARPRRRRVRGRSPIIKPRSRNCRTACNAPSKRVGAARSRIRMSSMAVSGSDCTASATSSSAFSPRAATTSIPRAPITIPIWCRRTIIWRFTSGSGATSTRTPSSISASMAISNGCPGKSVGLSANCLPDAVLGPLPHLYPFIVNDPGEGIQAKRRSAAVIIDHLTPPMTRAELHDDLARLETLVDEYALAADLDPKRAAVIAEDILSLARAQRLDADVNVTRETPTNDALRALDAHLCDLKEMQIRDGLHVFGRTPQPAQRNDLLVSIARLPRSDSKPQDASLHRALALDLGLGDFDPLDARSRR